MDVKVIEMKGMLLPPAEGRCRICAVAHEPCLPHDATSLFYGVRFRMRYGREGTWADAVAHMPERGRALVRRALENIGGTWTEPPAGVEPIAEPIDG